ncbi:MAG: type IV pilus biogenesis/stability protein PilW [Burkholderiales bacterium]|nr:type IV pilus biogenesis/stability protein PilW [Burkholderiales bacterium]
MTRMRFLTACWLVFCAVMLGGCAAGSGSSEGMIPGGAPAQRQPNPDGSPRGAQPGGIDRQEVARIRTELAFNYFQNGQLAIALEEVRAAIASDPNNASAFNVLGLINMDLGDNPRAEEAFRRSLQIAPNDSDLLNNFGWFLCQTKRERESIDRFLAALKNPLYTSPDKAYLNAGICSQRIGNDGAAEDYYRRAFALNPGNPAVLMRLSDLYFRRGLLNEARFYADRFNRSFEVTAESLWLALRIERAAGDRAAESSFATQLRRRYPNSQEFLLLQQGKFE